jgi:hypothetical protein
VPCLSDSQVLAARAYHRPKFEFVFDKRSPSVVTSCHVRCSHVATPSFAYAYVKFDRNGRVRADVKLTTDTDESDL